MTTKRDRSNEMQVYISKEHHEKLKVLSEMERRTMRSTLEYWVDHYYAKSTLYEIPKSK